MHGQKIRLRARYFNIIGDIDFEDEAQIGIPPTDFKKRAPRHLFSQKIEK